MENIVYLNHPDFTGRNVPITEIAKAIGKDAQYVRVGLQKGVLKFGYAMKLDNPTNTITTVLTKGYGKKPDILEPRMPSEITSRKKRKSPDISSNISGQGCGKNHYLTNGILPHPYDFYNRERGEI